MSRDSQTSEAARVKCIPCNARAIETETGDYVCVECGERPVRADGPDRLIVEDDGVRLKTAVQADGRYASQVRFTIESAHEVPVAVRITQPLHETIYHDVELNGAPAGGEWTRTQTGLEFSGTVEPTVALETSYHVAVPEGNPHLLGNRPRIDAVTPVDPATADAQTAPTWRGGAADAVDTTASTGPTGGPEAAHRPIAANGGGAIETETTDGRPTLESATPAESADPEPVTPLPQEPVSGPRRGTESRYLLPPGSAATPVISVVLPTRDEQAGIGPCIEAVISALETLEVTGEVIVSDSSTDHTPDIARRYGAKVVTPERAGYGAAIRYGFEHARGEYIVMGDADTTYDFEELPRLLEPVRDGDADLVMGSRFAGEIKPGAMPWLHRKIGNPLLTKFLNTFYAAEVTDAHSGFRVITRDALDELELQSDGMEFASEMVMAAGEAGLTIAETPITYHPRVGEATLDSFADGWRHVKFMLTNTPTYVFSLPAIGLTTLGLVAMALSVIDSRLLGVTFGTHTVIAGSLLTIIGYQIASLAVFSAVAGTAISDPEDRVTAFIKDHFKLEHGATIGLGMYTVGAVYVAAMIIRWVSSGYASLPFVEWNMIAFTLIVLGLQTVFYSFFLSLLGQRSA